MPIKQCTKGTPPNGERCVESVSQYDPDEAHCYEHQCERVNDLQDKIARLEAHLQRIRDFERKVFHGKGIR